MATFDSGKKEVVQEEEEAVVRFPIKRLEPTIKKFLKIVEIDLERLQRHKDNIRKLTMREEWEALDKEQVNATRTVQQIKANLREIEHARDRTALEDLHLFDRRVEGTKLTAREAVESFITMATPSQDATDRRSTFGASRSESSPEGSPASFTEGASFPLHQSPAFLPANLTAPQGGLGSLETSGTAAVGEEGEVPAVQPLQLQTQLHAAPDHVSAAASWEHLQESLADLSSMMASFASTVKVQGEAIDRIEDNIEKADANITEGTQHLAKGASYKAAILPVTGAVIGTVMGGPVGLFLGMKVGSLMAVGGGVAGFMGGRLLKKQTDKSTTVEMQNLKERRSNSLPDVAKQSSS